MNKFFKTIFIVAIILASTVVFISCKSGKTFLEKAQENEVGEDVQGEPGSGEIDITEEEADGDSQESRRVETIQEEPEISSFHVLAVINLY